MIEGSCLCGGIRYQYDGEIEEISLCHCAQCRKAQGSAFAANSPVDSARFKLLAGAEPLPEEMLALDAAHHRVLARDVAAVRYTVPGTICRK